MTLLLAILAMVTLLARLVGLKVSALGSWAAAIRVGLAVMFCITAAAHFNSMRPELVAMVPPWIPAPGAMVTFTGLCELAGAVGLLVPRTRRAAAMALIVFLLAILPANVHAARAGLTLRGAPVTPLVPRIAGQALFIALVWWSGLHAERRRGPEERP
jgi:uncharacterized membrane protein